MRTTKARATSPRTQLTYAVAVAEVDDHCSAQQQEQADGGQRTDHRDGSPDQDAEDCEDLQPSDSPVGLDAEADVVGPGAHGGHGGELGCAEHAEGDDEDSC